MAAQSIDVDWYDYQLRHTADSEDIKDLLWMAAIDWTLSDDEYRRFCSHVRRYLKNRTEQINETIEKKAKRQRAYT